MKRIWIAAAAVALPIAAQAEGVSASQGTMLGPLTAPAANWSGFYIGGHAGKGWGKWDGPLSYDDVSEYPEIEFDYSKHGMDGNDWLGGIQVGTNYQTGKLVVGLEADVSWTGIEASGTFLPYPNNYPDSPSWAISTKIDMMGTVRGRLGYTTGPLLIYGTAGLAWANVESNLVNSYSNFASADNTHFGWTVGGGLEWALGSNWSIRGEYLYMDLGEQDYAFVGNGGTYDTDHYHPELILHVIRGGINYKF